MQFYAWDGQHQVLARDAERGRNYRCPECLNFLRARSGPHRQPHFYHLQTHPLCRQHKKSLTHLQLQLHLQQILPPGESALERPFPKIGRIGDVVWETRKIVFEIQCSPMSLAEAKERCRDYNSAGFEIVWILHKNRFNRRNLSAAEAFLRESTCYFTDMDANGKGVIYDQFDLCLSSKRIFKGIPLKVDLSKPSSPPPFDDKLPSTIQNRLKNWPLYFRGDLLDKALQRADLRSIFEMEKRFFSPRTIPSTNIFLKIYKAIFHSMLEKVSK